MPNAIRVIDKLQDLSNSGFSKATLDALTTPTAGNLRRATDNVRGMWMAEKTAGYTYGHYYPLAGRVWNIEAYGCMPGNVNTYRTQNATALAALIAAASSWDTIYVPGQIFRFDAGVTINKPLNLCGEGVNSCLAFDLSSSQDAITYDASGSSVPNIYIENLMMIINGRHGIVAKLLRNSKIENVHIMGTTSSSGYATKLVGCQGCRVNIISSSNFDYPYSATNKPTYNGLYIDGVTAAANANWLDLLFEGQDGVGLYVEESGSNGYVYVRGLIEGCHGYGVHLSGCNLFDVTELYMEMPAADLTENCLRIENCTQGKVNALEAPSVYLINSDYIALDEVRCGTLSIDADCRGCVVGNVKWKTTSSGTFEDLAPDTIYTGAVINAQAATTNSVGGAWLADQQNLLRNPGFEAWNGVVCQNWSTSLGSYTQEQTTVLFGSNSLKYTEGASGCLGGITLGADEIKQVKGRWVTGSLWVNIPSSQSTQPIVAVRLYTEAVSLGGGGWVVYTGESEDDTGTSWRQLTVTAFIPSDATRVDLQVYDSITVGSYFFVDGMALVVGRAGPIADLPRLPKAIRGYYTWDPASLAPGESANTNFNVSGAEVGDIVSVGFPLQIATGDPSHRNIQMSGFVPATGVVSICVTNNNAATTLDFVSGTIKVIVWKD
jgi:hypothetical protein